MIFQYNQDSAGFILDIWKRKPLFLDTETTGLDHNAEIIEICIVDYDGTVLLDKLVKPVRRIPADVISVHGINNQMVENAPNWLMIWGDVERILRNRVVGFYNAEFDVRMLKQTHRANGFVWKSPMERPFCIMKMYSSFHRLRRWQKLEQAGRQLGIPLLNSHRAKDDTLLARKVFIKMLEIGNNY